MFVAYSIDVTGIGFMIFKTFFDYVNVIACTRKNNKNLKRFFEKLFPKL